MRKFLKDAAAGGNLSEILSPTNIGFILLLFIPVLYFLISRRHLPPGPFAIPFVGHLHVIGNGKFLYRKLMLMKKKYGSIYRLQIGGRNAVIVLGHDLIRQALVVKGDRFQSRPDWIPNLGKQFSNKGFLWSNDDTWKKMHNLAVSSVKHLVEEKGDIEDLIHEEAQLVANELFVCKGRPVDLRKSLSRAVFNILYGFVIRERNDFETPDGDRLYTAVQAICRISPLQILQSRNPLSRFFSEANSVQSLPRTTESLIDALCKLLTKHKETRTVQNTRHLVDCCLKANDNSKEKKVEDENLLQAFLDVFVAGFEPTVNTLLWIFLYMVKYPEVQYMCRTEMNKVAKPPKAITCKDEINLPFVTATLQEVQRISNVWLYVQSTAKVIYGREKLRKKGKSVPLGVPHTTDADTELGGYKIPKGYIVLLHLYSSHMDHTYWTRPQEFRPEHFLDSNSRLTKHDTFFPYGIGSRSCPFSSLARKILFIFFTTVLTRYQLNTPDGSPVPSTEAEDNVCRCPRPYNVSAVPLG